VKAYILRSLSGGGKSTLAAMLQPNQEHVHSTDKYFTDEHGKYVFDPKRLGTNHAFNLAAFSEDCRNRVEVVVCDNTNTQHWEYAQYVKIAESHGYQVHVITVGSPKDPEFVAQCAKRNAHGLDVEKIKKMSDRWEY
jgi:predicted kinase